MTSIENIVGTDFSDEVYGNADDNTYTYFQGAALGGGTDLFNGGGGVDTLDFSDGTYAIWVELGYSESEVWTRDATTAYSADVGAWRAIVDLTSVERIVGTAFSDEFIGDANDNTFVSNGGEDRIRGGAGDDTFVFATNDSFGTTVISDFSADDGEQIDLSGVFAIMSFADLVNNHISDVGGVVQINDGSGVIIELTGWLETNIGVGNPLSEADFIF